MVARTTVGGHSLAPNENMVAARAFSRFLRFFNQRSILPETGITCFDHDTV
jgi:hypothetical protein